MKYKDALDTIRMLTNAASLNEDEASLLESSRTYVTRANREVASFLSQAQTARGRPFTENELSFAIELMTERNNPDALVTIAEKKADGSSSSHSTDLKLAQLAAALEADIAARHLSAIPPVSIQYTKNSIASFFRAIASPSTGTDDLDMLLEWPRPGSALDGSSVYTEEDRDEPESYSASASGGAGSAAAPATGAAVADLGLFSGGAGKDTEAKDAEKKPMPGKK